MFVVWQILGVLKSILEHPFFAGITLLILLWAWVKEIRDVQKYQQDNKDTREAIKYLKDKKSKSNGSNQVFISHAEVEKLGNKGWNWIEKHIQIEPELVRGQYEIKLHDSIFILLQYPSVLARSIPRSSLSFVPTLLTAIGLIGTFWGISTGLSKFDLKAINQSDKLLAASIGVLGGMKTAFTSSLVGLACASLFMLVLAWSAEARKKHRDKLRNDLDDIAVLSTTEDAEQRTALALSNAAQTMINLTPQAIGQEVGAALKPIFQEIRQELSALKEIKKDQGQEVMNNLIQSLRTDVILPIAERLDQSAKLTQEASNAVMNLQSELGSVSKNLADSILTIQHFQKETLGRLEDFAGGLKETLGQFQTETKIVLEEVAQEIKLGVDQSIVGMEAQRTAFAQSATNAADTFRGIRVDLQAALHTQAEVEKQMLTDVEARMTNILQTSQTAFQTQTTTLATLGNEASGLMNNARENLVGSLQNIDGMLQNTRQTVQEELEHFRQGYQASLQDFFTQQNNLLESTLGEQRQGLAQVVEDLQTTFQAEATKRQMLGQEVDRSMTKIQGTVEVVSNLANTVGLNSGARMAQIQELSQGMGKQVRELESAYNNLADKFQKGDEQLTKHLHRAIESNTVFFTQADEATAKLCNNLLLAANYLVAAEDNNRRDRASAAVSNRTGTQS